MEEAHDRGGHRGFESTFLKVRRRYYWPHQGDDVKRYIRGCPECAKQNPWTRKPPIFPIITIHPFQIIGMDFIGPLTRTARHHSYILHFVDYFSSFSIAFPTVSSSADDVLPTLETTFNIFPSPRMIYMDNGPHFTNGRVQMFFSKRGVKLEDRPTEASKSTGKIESTGRLIQETLRKILSGRPGARRMQIVDHLSDLSSDWDLALPEAVRAVNNRIIPHLRYSPTEILFGMSRELTNMTEISFDGQQEIPPLARAQNVVRTWSPREQAAIVFTHMVNVCKRREYTRRTLAQAKIKQAEKINGGRAHAEFPVDTFVMVKQHNPSKFAPRYRGPFRIVAPSSSRHISYRISYLDGRLFPYKVHSDDLKPFTPRTSYLFSDDDHPCRWADQTIRAPRSVKRYAIPP